MRHDSTASSSWPALSAARPQIPKGAIPLGLYWDTEDPYHYVRLLGDEASAEDTLIVGGEDHKTGQATDMEIRYERLERWARSRFPAAGRLTTRWSGQVMEPVDGVAYIGRATGGARNVYVITGDSGQGMTHGTLGAELVSDLVMGRPNPWEQLYRPSRSALTSTSEWFIEWMYRPLTMRSRGAVTLSSTW